MSLFRRIFPKKHTLLIVIHAESQEQILRNLRIAYEAGVDGVFLINHRIFVNDLLRFYLLTRIEYPNWWIGVNFLGLDVKSAIKLAVEHSIQGVWFDNAGVEEDAKDPCVYTRTFRDLQERGTLDRALLFGGVAFKYQPEVKDPARVAHLASRHIDVITTSGKGTGCAPDIKKISSMKKAIDDHPLAIASGITPENVSQYMPYTDCFLVSTGVSDSFSDIHPVRLRELVQAIAEHSKR